MSSHASLTAEIGASPLALSLRDRWLAAVAAAALVALLATAAVTSPDPRGFGTHERLGLGPCSFRQWTGIACPSCGMTTAWAHAVRGELRQAAAANLAGAGLCLAALVAAPWLAWAALRGEWPWRRPRWDVAVYCGTIALGVAALDWVRRLTQ